MSIIEALREYIIQFPDLPEGAVCVDFLGAEPSQFTLEAVPCDPVYRRYTDGGALKQYLFVFASRFYFGADVTLCMENQVFFEKLEAWVRSNDRAGILPKLSDAEAVRLDVVTSGYVFSESPDTARYQMQLRLIYAEN